MTTPKKRYPRTRATTCDCGRPSYRVKNGDRICIACDQLETHARFVWGVRRWWGMDGSAKSMLVTPWLPRVTSERGRRGYGLVEDRDFT